MRAQWVRRFSCKQLSSIPSRAYRMGLAAGELKEQALRALNGSRMHYVREGWPLRPKICPCDVHFCEYLKERDIRTRAIFHFGTGGHHIVGLRNKAYALDNDVFGITASPAEHTRYIKELIHSARLGAHYKVLFADIYNLNEACLPTFDVVSLFHLGEVNEPAGPGRRLDDAGVLELFLGKVAPLGCLLFYTGSWGYARTRRLLEPVVAHRRMRFEEQYKSLVVYRKASTQV